jgi:hypothetical protein
VPPFCVVVHKARGAPDALADQGRADAQRHGVEGRLLDAVVGGETEDGDLADAASARRIDSSSVAARRRAPAATPRQSAVG